MNQHGLGNHFMQGLLSFQEEFSDIGAGNSKIKSQLDEIRDLT